MARWTLAGSAGSVAGPLLLVAVLGGGGTWRTAYLLLAGCAAVAWLGVARPGHRPMPAAGTGPAQPADAPAQPADMTVARKVVGIVRQRDAMRWVALLQIADLLLDVLTGFLAVYLVDVVHATPAQAALGVTIRLAAGLAGDVVLIGVLERAGSLAVLRVSAVAAAVLYPGFLLVPGLWLKLAGLALLTVATAPWYPVMQAELYRSLPGQSGIAVSLTSAASLVGGVGPAAIGFLAERFGLAWALAGLILVPTAMVIALKRRFALARG